MKENFPDTSFKLPFDSIVNQICASRLSAFVIIISGSIAHLILMSLVTHASLISDPGRLFTQLYIERANNVKAKIWTEAFTI